MSESALYLEVVKNNLDARPRISRGIHHATRECRADFLNAHEYHVLLVGDVSLERYANLLRTHLFIRKALEELCDSLGGEFVVKALANSKESLFSIDQYLTTQRIKSPLLLADLADLPCQADAAAPLPDKAKALIDYMARVRDVFSAGLLGILYMLEETVTYAGPIIARNIDRQHSLGERAQRYLRGASTQKADLWELRRSLDLITNFQTQINIVTAASISYRLYRDLIDPNAAFWPKRPERLN